MISNFGVIVAFILGWVLGTAFGNHPIILYALILFSVGYTLGLLVRPN